MVCNMLAEAVGGHCVASTVCTTDCEQCSTASEEFVKLTTDDHQLYVMSAAYCSSYCRHDAYVVQLCINAS